MAASSRLIAAGTSRGLTANVLPLAYIYRANGYLGLSQADRALADLEQALRLSPGDVRVILSRGRIFAATNRHDRAVQEFTRAIQIDPNSFDAVSERAASYTALGQQDRARQDYQRMLDLTPNSAQGYQARAMAFFGAGQNERGIADLGEAIRLDPRNGAIFALRGAAFSELGRNQQALSDYDRAIELSAESWQLYYDRGYTRFALNDHVRAAEDLDRAVRLRPSEASPYMARASVRAVLGQSRTAIEDYETAVRLRPAERTADTLNRLCYLLAAGGAAALALPYCDEALLLRPGDAATLDSRAYAYLRLDRRDEALRDYDAAIAADPRHALARFGRAIVRALRGQPDGARADLEEARRLDPNVDTDAAGIGLAAPPVAAGAPGPAPTGAAQAAPPAASAQAADKSALSAPEQRPIPPGDAEQAATDVAARLRQLRGLLDQALITRAEYDEHRQRILNGL